MPKIVPERQITTRSTNKLAHPGYIDKAAVRRNKAEVEEERTTKALAKVARAEAKERSIKRTAEFEQADVVDEDIVDATPRQHFAPKCTRPPAEGNSSIAEKSYDEEGEQVESNFSENSVTTGDSAVDSEVSNRTEKDVVAKRGRPGRKDMRKTVVESDLETELDSNEETPVKKPKPAKRNVRDEINIASKEIASKQEGKSGN
jgi:hypothetical protein